MKRTLPALLSIASPHGIFVAHYTESGLAALDFPSTKSGRTTKHPRVPAVIRRWHALTTKAVKAVLAGRTPSELPPLDVSQGTTFQRRVWEELTWTPCGETRSYAEIAKAIRNPKAARAVGGACGANLIPLLIPCHRVLAASNKLGGFSGGISWKKKLLAIEGVVLR